MKDIRDVIGLNVFSVEEGRILGRTTECAVDLSTGDVIGLVVEVKGGVEMGIARADITAVGKDAVMVGSDKVMEPLGDIKGLDDHRITGKAAPRVLTRSGQVLGALGVVRVDEACERIESYEIVGDVVQAIADGPATLTVVEGTVHGRDAIVLPDDAVKAIKRSGGVRASFEKALATVRDAASDVSDKLTDAAKKARSAGEAAGEKALAKAKDARHVVEERVGGRKATPEAAAKEAPAKAKKKAAPKKKAAKKKKKKAPAKKAAKKKSSQAP